MNNSISFYSGPTKMRFAGKPLAEGDDPLVWRTMRKHNEHSRTDWAAKLGLPESATWGEIMLAQNKQEGTPAPLKRLSLATFMSWFKKENK